MTPDHVRTSYSFHILIPTYLLSFSLLFETHSSTHHHNNKFKNSLKKKKEYPEFARVLTKQKNKILMISFKIKQTQNYRDKSYKVVSFDSKRTNGNYASNPPKI